MDQPRNGQQALTLLLRLSMLRRRQRGGGSLAERGYSLAVALIASFVLLLGVAALASRGQLGFVGQVFQVQNRQARDVAESAIAEFIDTLNREENRFLLVAGNDNFANDPLNLNQCTRFDAAGNEIGANPDPITFDFLRFAPTLNPANADFRPLDSANINDTRRFSVESIRFLNQNRDPYNTDSVFNDLPDPEGGPLAQDQIREIIETGSNRFLIRITVVGRLINPNGRVSESRIAREFEVVPKCCKTSFGSNFRAVNWGRDETLCAVRQPPPPGGAGGGGAGFGAGIIVGLGSDEGGIDGSNNPKRIFDENGDRVTEAACWAGNATGVASDLQGDPNPVCTSGDMRLGNTAGSNATGISFAPTNFSFQYPPYTNPAGNPGFFDRSISGGKNYITYYDDGSGNPGIRFCTGISGGNYTGCSRLDNKSVSDPSPDPCYQVDSLDLSASPPRPYYTYNCQIGSLPSNANSTLLFDTSSARINLMFYDPSAARSVTYLGGSGNQVVSRVHCRSNLSSVPSGTAACTNLVNWNTFLGTCDLPGCGEEYNVRSLLNAYANGEGTFRLRGTAQAIAMNIYAPKAYVDLRGGGAADPNFMGQIWVDDLYLNGNVKINTFRAGGGGGFAGGGGPGGGGGGIGQPILVDYAARSFTQSSGF